MDAIAVSLACDGHAVGVAPLGTALTVEQAHLLASHTDHLWEATDNDPAGRAATVRDQDRYNDVGILARQLTLPHDQSPAKDPAELFTRPGGAEQLRAAVSLWEEAPTTAARLLADTVDSVTDELSRHNANVVVAVAKHAAKIIAPLPPDLWKEHVYLTADLVVGHQPGSSDADITHLRELIGNETRSAGQAWQPPTAADPFDNGRGKHTGAKEQPDINHDALCRARAMLGQLYKPSRTGPSHAPLAPLQFPDRDL